MKIKLLSMVAGAMVGTTSAESLCTVDLKTYDEKKSSDNILVCMG